MLPKNARFARCHRMVRSVHWAISTHLPIFKLSTDDQIAGFRMLAGCEVRSHCRWGWRAVDESGFARHCPAIRVYIKHQNEKRKTVRMNRLSKWTMWQQKVSRLMESSTLNMKNHMRATWWVLAHTSPVSLESKPKIIRISLACH